MLVNWYADGSHYIGAHSDDETQLADSAPIFSLSWGASRRFRMLPKTERPRKGEAPLWETDGPREKLTLELGDGDLLVMGGTCQKTHKHDVPKTGNLVGRRVNATFRTFAKPVDAAKIDGGYP